MGADRRSGVTLTGPGQPPGPLFKSTEQGEITQMPKLTIDAHKQSFDVDVNGRGQFHTEVSGATIYADTLAGLQTKVSQLMSRAKIKIDIPVTVLKGDELIDAVITGRNIRTRDVLAKRLDTGRAVEINRGYSNSDETFQRLTAAQKQELLALRKAVTEAEAAYEKFTAPLVVKVDQVVNAAINEAEKVAGLS
jgi:hypothetical protein